MPLATSKNLGAYKRQTFNACTILRSTLEQEDADNQHEDVLEDERRDNEEYRDYSGEDPEQDWRDYQAVQAGLTTWEEIDAPLVDDRPIREVFTLLRPFQIAFLEENGYETVFLLRHAEDWEIRRMVGNKALIRIRQTLATL